MRPPFPGMDPYLEHPALWPDVHNSLITAIRDSLSPRLAPRYFVGLERRTYLLTPDDIVFVRRPDVAVVAPGAAAVSAPTRPAAAGVIEVDVPLADEVSEYYLEIHEVISGRVVTILELLSPANKLHERGREEYERKR
ncbi:MAG: DUF4058 family protein, partial [Candidatus Promineifilaceae bacterium]